MEPSLTLSRVNYLLGRRRKIRATDLIQSEWVEIVSAILEDAAPRFPHLSGFFNSTTYAKRRCPCESHQHGEDHMELGDGVSYTPPNGIKWIRVSSLCPSTHKESPWESGATFCDHHLLLTTEGKFMEWRAECQTGILAHYSPVHIIKRIKVKPVKLDVLDLCDVPTDGSATFRERCLGVRILEQIRILLHSTLEKRRGYITEMERSLETVKSVRGGILSKGDME